MLLATFSAMIFTHSVAASNCSAEPEEDPVMVDEGDNALFSITINCDTTYWTWRTFRYVYNTQDDSANSPDDYDERRNGAHVFYPGNHNSTRTTGVNTYADNDCEGDEEFKLVYTLQGKTNAGWTDWSGGVGGLPGTLSVSSRINDKTPRC